MGVSSSVGLSYNITAEYDECALFVLLCRPFPKEVHHEYYQDIDKLLQDAEEEEETPSNEESIYANLNELAM